MKTYSMSILLCLISKNITHSIPTKTAYISKNSVSHINAGRSSKPIAYYSNSSATWRLILSSNNESNPGPDNDAHQIENRNKVNLFP